VPELINSLKNLIFSKDFLERNRISPTAFTRERQLPFHSLIFFLMKKITKRLNAGYKLKIFPAKPPCRFIRISMPKYFSKNLTAVISLTVKDEVKRISEQRKFEYQINFAQALSKMKHSIVLLLIRPMEIVQTMVSKLQKIFVQTIERIRPGRKYKRNHKVKRQVIIEVG
jgi:hypothetical protein